MTIDGYTGYLPPVLILQNAQFIADVLHSRHDVALGTADGNIQTPGNFSMRTALQPVKHKSVSA